MSCTTDVCGTGGWSGPKPGDPDNNSILTATPAFGGIDVSWTYPTTFPYAVAHTLVYRGILNNFNSAILLAVADGSLYFDKSAGDVPVEYFYWIQLVSINGTYGDVIGPASAVARPTIEETIRQLTGKIDAGVLAQSLKTEIEKITLNTEAIIDEADSRIAANTALSAALSQVQSGMTEALTFINTEITNRQNGDSALVTQLNTVAAANQNALALIQEEQTARVTGDSANAALYTTLNAQVNNVNTGLPATRAVLLNDYSTTATTNSAIASAVASLVSTTALNSALSAYTNTAALQTNYSTKTETNSAIASAVSTLVSTTALNNALGSYTNTAALQTNYYTKTATDSAISAAITTSQTTFNNNIASVQTTLQTNINTVNNKVTSIGALYTAKVSVNGLIGGFGVYNDGTLVEAGFDVDRFWVGRTSSDKKKPFIIENDEVFIDNAVINNLTADKIDTRGLSIKDANGVVIFSAGNALDFSRIGGATRPANNATVGAPAGTYVGNIPAESVESLSGAQSKADAAANWAVSASQTYAAAQAEAARVTANAYADGKVTAEEQRAIADATNKAEAARILAVNAAAADASAKANLAATTAIWSGVSGAGRPADGATVGAPSGTYVGGTLAQTVESNASSALSTANAASAALANKLDKASTSILNIDTASAVRMSGIRVGNLAWDASGNRTSGTGIALTPAGLLGHNGSHVTFAVNATTGDATFAGALSAATGSFAGSLSAATGSFSGSLTASAVNAVNTINIAGNAVTIPVSAYTAAWVNGTTTEIDIQSISVTSSGGSAFIFGSFTGRLSNIDEWGTADARVRIYRNSTLILEEAITPIKIGTGGITTLYENRIMVSFRDTPTVGTHTYKITYYGVGAGSYYPSAYNRLLMYLETKR